MLTRSIGERPGVVALDPRVIQIPAGMDFAPELVMGARRRESG
jgi:hypothetical protein